MRLTRGQYNVIEAWLRLPETREKAIRNGENKEELAERFNWEHREHPDFGGITVTKNHFAKVFKETGIEYPRGRSPQISNGLKPEKMLEIAKSLHLQMGETVRTLTYLFSQNLASHSELRDYFTRIQSARNVTDELFRQGGSSSEGPAPAAT